MNHGSLFSGIGGFDYAAKAMGWNNVFHCEINPLCQHVLKYYYPTSISYEDIKRTDFTIHRGTIDVLSGGFPCQPYSAAGKRLGKEDDRHLWPEMLRAIREIQPRWVVGENVRGFTNWNEGVVFDEVQSDLEAEGYEVLPFLLPAVAIDAPHRRDRIWIIAYSESKQSEWRKLKQREFSKSKQGGFGGSYSEMGDDRITTDTSYTRLQRSKIEGGIGESRTKQYKQPSRCILPNWENFPTQSPVLCGDDGLSSRLHGITFPKWRNESIKAYGNAVVPQIPYAIFKTIEEYERIIN